MGNMGFEYGSLEVNHHFKIGGLPLVINPYLKTGGSWTNLLKLKVVGLPEYTIYISIDMYKAVSSVWDNHNHR